MLTHAHKHASALRIYRPTHKHTLVNSHLRVRSHTHKQHALTCMLTHTNTHALPNMNAHNHSRSHIHTRECARNVCVWCVRCVCECVFVCVFV